LTRPKPHVTRTGEPDGPGRPDQTATGTADELRDPPASVTDKEQPDEDDISVGSDSPPAGSSHEGPTMNQDAASSVITAVLSIIEDVVDVRGQKITRPVLVRFAWFCVGAVFVLATVRSKSS
jgi:hypothetical protein